MEQKTRAIAVLIDADNAEAKLAAQVLEEVSKYGKATIRRIYGDWANNPRMASWKTLLNEHSITPIQQFAYTSGKNSTDSALIIDAMDILHSKNADGFCIVSSDSDYTALAKRIREAGLLVIGIGRKNTPVAFVQSCEIFTYTENLQEDERVSEAPAGRGRARSSKREAAPKAGGASLFDKKTTDMIRKVFDISTNESDQAYISTIGFNLRKIDPSFDPRTFGFKSLTKLFESLKEFVVTKDENNQPRVRMK